MIVNCKNGLEVDNNPYIAETQSLDGVIIKVGSNNVPIYELPTIKRQEFVLRYLSFANLLYIVIEEPNSFMTRIYILEQKLVKDKVEIENYYSTVIVDYGNRLSTFFRYDENFEADSIKNFLTCGLEITLSYALSVPELKKQITDLLARNNKPELNEIPEIEEEAVEEKEEKTQMTQSIRELAKEHGIAYNTLWGRIRNRHMTVEEALAVGNSRAKVTNKKKHPDVTYEGKNLRQLSEETGISYPKLWDRVHRQGRTVEEALAMGNKTKK